MNIPLEDQIKCAKRELAMRKNVYPKWVAQGRMKREKALHECECMGAILDTLEGLKVQASEITNTEHPKRRTMIPKQAKTEYAEKIMTGIKSIMLNPGEGLLRHIPKYTLNESGEPVKEDDYDKWRAWMDGADRLVGETTVGPHKVITFFLGHASNFMNPYNPQQWCTAITGEGPAAGGTVCCSGNKIAAQEMHKKIVSEMRTGN